MTGDIGNALIKVETNEKFYARCGSKFGNCTGSIAVIFRALYGLTTSAEHCCTKFADCLRTLRFIPCRFDRDVWMHLRDDQDGYDIIYTHIDGFKVVAEDPGM